MLLLCGWWLVCRVAFCWFVFVGRSIGQRHSSDRSAAIHIRRRPSQMEDGMGGGKDKGGTLHAAHDSRRVTVTNAVTATVSSRSHREHRADGRLVAPCAVTLPMHSPALHPHALPPPSRGEAWSRADQCAAAISIRHTDEQRPRGAAQLSSAHSPILCLLRSSASAPAHFHPSSVATVIHPCRPLLSPCRPTRTCPRPA